MSAGKRNKLFRRAVGRQHDLVIPGDHVSFVGVRACGIRDDD
jgi:hypothetical protein